MSSNQHCVLLLTADPLVGRGARKAAAAAGLPIVTAGDRSELRPAAIVVDLEQPGAIDHVSELRAQHPDAILVGHVSMPDSDRWLRAERAGCDLVANRGAVGLQLKDRLSSIGTERRRFPLVDDDDVAGRLGLVAKVPETPFGDVAVYHVDGAVTVIDDVCPHAGAQLSDGSVEGGVVTCPRHGSQFDVCTGERLRGPADRDVKLHQTVRDGGRLHLVWG